MRACVVNASKTGIFMTPEAVLSHYDSGMPWPQDGKVDDDLQAAYRLALRVRALREQRGEHVTGYKVGFTNRTIWSRYQVFAPIWGPVWNTTLAHCDGHGTLDLKSTSLPRLEPELVFGLGRTPPATPTLEQVFGCIDWVATGFEVVQSHRADWKFTAAETIADGALHARLLIGRQAAVRDLASSADELDALLSAAQLTLFRGGVSVDHGPGSNVLGSPLQALTHFVHEFQSLPQSHELMPGDVVTTGTWTDAWPVQSGESWQLKLDIGIESLAVDFR